MTRKGGAPLPSHEPAPGEAGALACSAPDSPADTADADSAIDFPVVAIGASAGALEALKKFFKAMPMQSGMAFVVIVHLDPEHVSHLPELLGHYTGMGVAQALDGERVAADHVYLIPPNTLLSLENGCLRLEAAVARPRIPMPIDHFLRSLAENQQERAVAILLSGTGSDGTLGLKEVKAVGGLVMAQQPDTAEYGGMPRSAIATGMVDVVSPVEAMPKALLDYVEHTELRGDPQPATADPQPEQLHELLALLRLRGGYDFRCYKKAMLLRRVRRRMGLNQIATLADYCRHLRDSPTELKSLAQDLLISVTAFFREPQAWEVLAAEVVPALVAAKPQDAAIRVWVAGCATGEEAYSIGMLFLERMDAHPRNGKIQVFATDIDKPALETARAGLYPESIAASFPPQRLARFFSKTDAGYQVKKDLREIVTFAPQNLVTDAPFSHLDLVSCRNLLIYLEPELQQKVIGLFHFSLNPGGYLFLGKSETIGQQRGLFDLVSKPWRIYRRNEAARPGRVDLPLMAGYRADTPEPWPKQHPRPAAGGYGAWVGNLLLQRYAPATVLVNRDYQVLYFFGQTDDYLAQPAGDPTDDLLALAREGLRLKLRTGIHQALGESREVAVLAEVARGGESWPAQVTVTPVDDPRQGGAGLCLVSFRPAEPECAQAPAPCALEDADAMNHLERELARVKHELESAIQDLEASNEELKVSNEEALSMNEELQSTNEELETSKEEMQSLNEELTTVNTQLEEKIVELESNNNDLGNLLASTHLATLFLDRRFHIKRFTPACTRLFNLIPSDINRPITDIAGQCADAGMIAEARRVLDTLEPSQQEVSTTDGEWYLRRVLPYRTQDDHIEGVVVTFADITPIKRATLGLQRLAAVARDSNDAIILFDFSGHLLAWNRAAEAMYGYGEAEALQLNIDALVSSELRPAQRELVERVRHGEAIKSYEIQRVAKGGRRIEVWLTVSLLRDEAGAPMAIATTERDVTEKNRAEQASRERESRFRQLAEANVIGVVIAADGHDGILNANDAFLELIGRTREELSAGRLRWTDLVPSEHLSLDRQAMADLQSQGICPPYETEYLRQDGTRVPVLTGCARTQAPGEYICFAIDLSVSKRLEAALREHTETLTEVNRRKDEFLAMLAHELRNPLAAVLNAAQVLEGQGGKDPQRVSWAGAMIKRQAGHLAHIIDDLLDIARIDRGQINLEQAPIDLRPIVAQMVESARLSTDTRRLALALPDEPLWANADANRLTQVVGNLVDNAIKYSQEGGRIDVSLALENDEAVLRVHDTGIGMDAAMLANAFELFSQAERPLDRASGGLGLGLALVKRLVELHGGRVEASSAGSNQGSEFTVRLPALPPGADLPPAPAAQRPGPDLTPSRHILIAEDNVHVARSFAFLLENLGHQVTVADSGPAALQAAQGFIPDAAFLDIGLPGMDGYELARRLRLDPRFGKLKLVALSGYATEEDKQRCRQAGFDQHLAKPVNIEDIEAILAKL